MPASATKRHETARVGSPHARRFVSGVAALVLLGAALAIAGAGSAAPGRMQTGTPAASPEASPIASPAETRQRVTFTTGEVTIEISDETMTPANIESAVGHELTITVVNTGSEPHGFVIDELDVDLELEPGQEETIEIGAPDLGEYRFYSDLPGDDGLEGMLTIFI